MLDFTNKNTQVELNQNRLKEESERYYEIKSRIGILSIFYSIFAAYSVQLMKFAITNESLSWIYSLFFIVFLFLFSFSIFFAIRLLIPKKVAFKEVPKKFYKELYEEYLNDSRIPNEQVKYYIRESYLNQLEKAVDSNYKLNNRKSKFHYYAFTFALLAIIPYLTCIGIKTTKEPVDIQKVELTNKYFKIDSLINFKFKEIIMPENAESNQEQAAQTNEEPTINPDLVIQREPEMIKENKNVPETKQSNSDNGK
jgi:hypothetical protein